MEFGRVRVGTLKTVRLDVVNDSEETQVLPDLSAQQIDEQRHHNGLSLLKLTRPHFAGFQSK